MQMSLHHESIADALREVVQAAGGPKAIGERMFPDMPADHAAARIRDCLNHDRRERFTPDQVLMILRIGHQIGCHAGMVFMSRELGYSDPIPVEPEDRPDASPRRPEERGLTPRPGRLIRHRSGVD